jgi:hypothetical protein
MRGAIIYGSGDVRGEERSHLMIIEPTDAAPQPIRTPLKKRKWHPDGACRIGLGAEESSRYCSHRRAYQATSSSRCRYGLAVHLTDEEISSLEEPYHPHLPTAF